jgi:formamidopyrimidine-DNA glycosylase
MPELPEVETIVQGLSSRIIDKTIIAIKSTYPQIVRDDFNEFKKNVIDKTIVNISRHGKYLFLHLNNKTIVVVHLRMTGQIFVTDKDSVIDKHTHLELFFADSEQKVIYRDIRKFGRFELIHSNRYEAYIKNKKLAVDALAISLSEFEKNLCGKKKILKAVLLDQSVIAGIGNIYVDEILFRERLSPETMVSSLSKQKIKSLLQSIKDILNAAVIKKGTSFSDYVDAIGQKGKFQYELKVYQQQGKPCDFCGTTIVREKLAGRGTHYCPKCQDLTHPQPLS